MGTRGLAWCGFAALLLGMLLGACTLDSGGRRGGPPGADDAGPDASGDAASDAVSDGPPVLTDGAAPDGSDPGSDGIPETECDAEDNDSDSAIDEGACPGCSVRRREGHTYLFCGAAPGQWAPAKAHCEARGYHLVTVDDADENAWVGQYAVGTPSASGSEGWWIGLSRNTTPGFPQPPMPGAWVWSWVSGSSTFGVPPSAPPWWAGQPDNGSSGFPNTELCVEIGFYSGAAQTGRWNDLPCGISALSPFVNRRWVCEAEPDE